MQTDKLTESRFLLRDVGEGLQRSPRRFGGMGNGNVCYLNSGSGSMDVYMYQELSDCTSKIQVAHHMSILHQYTIKK